MEAPKNKHLLFRVHYVRQKTKINKIDTIKEMIRTLGMNPELLLSRDALSKGAITNRNQEDLENHQMTILATIKRVNLLRSRA